MGPAHNQRRENPCLQFLLYAHELGTFAAPDDSFSIFIFISSKTQDILTLTLNHVFTVIKPADLSHAESCLFPPAHIIICMAIQEAQTACSA